MLSSFVLRVKQLNDESYTLYWNLKSFFPFIRKSGDFVLAPREGTCNEVLRGEWNGKIASNMVEEGTLE